MVCGKGSFKSGEIFLDQRVPNRRRIRNTFGFSFGARSAQRYVSAALGASIAIAEGLQLGQFQQFLNQPPNQAMSLSSAFTKNVTTDSL
jgi:hypothetical protein